MNIHKNLPFIYQNAYTLLKDKDSLVDHARYEVANETLRSLWHIINIKNIDETLAIA